MVNLFNLTNHRLSQVTEEPSESTDQLENLVCAEKLRVVDDLNNVSGI
jgi:hypothetical protein